MSQINIGDPFFDDLACMRIKLGVNSDQSYSPVYEKALNSDDVDFHKSVSDELEYYVGLEEILINSIQFQNSLIKGVVPILLKKDKGRRSLDILKILQYLTSISTANNISPEELFFELDKYPVVSLDYNFIFSLNNDELFRAALISESKIAKQLIEVLNSHFKNANAGVWNEAFNSLNSRELKMLKNIEFNEWNRFALESFGKKLIQIAKDNDEQDLDNILFITESLEKSGNNLINTFKDLRDEFIVSNKISAIHFRTFIGQLFKYSSLDERAADVLRTIFKSDFLDDPECVKIMQMLNNEIKSLLGKCKSVEKSDFTNALIARITNPDVRKLCENIEIDIPKEEDR
jgi:hypothetical protein